MTLRKVTFEDWEILLDWRNNIETRRNSHNMDLIDEETHKKWLNSILSDNNRHLFMGIENGKAVGTVRADFDVKSESYELSWTISPYFRGKGIGKIIVKLLTDQLDAKVRAEIKPGNVPSIKIAEYSGMSFNKLENGILHYSNF